MPGHVAAWIGFGVFLLVVLTVDLGVLSRKSDAPSLKRSIVWSAVWIGLALIFGVGIFFVSGAAKAVPFLTSYVVELSLSVDNLFVFLLVFAYFKVPDQYREKALFWGIIGALIMRVVLIFAGLTLITKFHWITYVFGAVLVVSGMKMMVQKDKEIHPEKNPVLRLFRRFIDFAPDYNGGQFFIRRNDRVLASPLLAVVLILESADLVFAVDSVPAVLAISPDPFIVLTSNAFAVLGLRSMFFALEGVIKQFEYLHYGLAGVLIFVGAKMSVAAFYKPQTFVSLLVILGLLTASIVASVLHKPSGDSRKIPC